MTKKANTTEDTHKEGMEVLFARIHAALRPRSRKVDGFPGTLVSQHELARAADVHPSVVSRIYSQKQHRWSKKTLAKLDAGLRILSEWQTKRAERLREIVQNEHPGSE